MPGVAKATQPDSTDVAISNSDYWGKFICKLKVDVGLSLEEIYNSPIDFLYAILNSYNDFMTPMEEVDTQ